jgi:hypothetical protein
MNILLPKTITTAMFATGTNIPAVDSSVGEVAWATGGTFAVGDRRTDGNYWYECVKAVSGSPANTYAPSSVLGASYWAKDEEAPTNRWAPFDEYLFSKARRVGDVTYVLTPGFVDGVAVHGIEADKLTISATMGAGGANLIEPQVVDLWQQAYGLYEYLFGDLQHGTKYTLKGIPLHPDVHITVKAERNTPTEQAAIGYISVGRWQQLFAPGSLSTNASTSGASAEIRSYSYFRQNEQTGLYTRKRGRQSIDLSIPCVVNGNEGERVRNLLATVLDVPVAMEASDLAQYSWLSTVGFITGRIGSPSKGLVEIDFKVKGNP